MGFTSSLRWLAASIAIVILALASMAATAAVTKPEPVATVTIQYQQNERKNAPIPEVFFGKYWGSGNGTISGTLNGKLHWDLYEDQSRDDLHRGQLVGVVVTENGDRIPFESLGFYKPREGGYWDLTASIHFDCKAPGCPWTNSAPLLWKGTVKWGEWIHRARLYAIEN